jgi:hypothetical protein
MLVLAERENAIMSLLEETDRETRDTVERLHWEAVARLKLIMFQNNFYKWFFRVLNIIVEGHCFEC